MDRLTDLDSASVLDEVAPRVVARGSATLLVTLRRGSPGNDVVYEDPAISNTDAWARHALAANGFGDAAATATPPSARSTSYEMYHAARAYRSFTLGEIIVAAIQAVGAIARRGYARHRQRRQARAIYDALRQLDNRTLRDLGFDRSEITSVAAEVTGEAVCTRVRALNSSTRGGFATPAVRETNKTKLASR